MNFEKRMEILELIENFELKEFKITDVIHNDLYRHMNNAGLFDYDYIERGQISSKRTKRKASKTNMVFLVWLMIARDLKDFGLVNNKLHIVKNYLFNELDLLSDTKESFYDLINWKNITDEAIKTELKESLQSVKNSKNIKDKKASRIFYNLFKLLYTKSDIKLYVKSNGEALFVDELEISKKELANLSYAKSIVLPLKNYLTYLIGEYASTEFLTRSKILTENEAILIDEFKRADIKSLTIRYHDGKANLIETTRVEKLKILSRLSDVIKKTSYQDIIIKTSNGNITYSEITRRKKLKRIN